MSMQTPGVPWPLANPGAPYAPEPVKQEKPPTDCKSCGAPLLPVGRGNDIQSLYCRR